MNINPMHDFDRDPIIRSWFLGEQGHLILVVVVVVAFPLLGLRVGSSFSFPHCTHLLQSAHLRLRRTYLCMLSACFWTPRLLLCHPGSLSLTFVHDLKCMRTLALLADKKLIISFHKIFSSQTLIWLLGLKKLCDKAYQNLNFVSKCWNEIWYKIFFSLGPQNHKL